MIKQLLPKQVDFEAGVVLVHFFVRRKRCRQDTCRRRSTNILYSQGWLDDAHLDVAMREMRRRLRGKTVLGITPCIAEHWFQLGNKDLASKVDGMANLSLLLIPLSNASLQGGGSHWTLLVLERRANLEGPFD